MRKTLIASLMLLAAAPALAADTATVEMSLLAPEGNTQVGTITLTQTEYGLVLTPDIHGLTAGQHGFHIHANGSCEPATKDGKTVLAGAAGGHYDPDNTGKHGHPWDTGNHKGDLPALYVDHHGNANYPVLAPKLTLNEVKGKAIMVHVGGDNHSDHPAPLGGGGARMACGVIQ
ncbi:superoxide dismutase [Cu-Zn] SodC [Shewanella sp. GXUN23E]|uniref:superoxide dismutase [Cu-Zn] SodC n=1 Tax=Shewanella sp. GXUN23E TaxID=3422498 RepID=UPI003D7CAC03